jgi:AraC-like DNA-binding protein
VYAAVESQLTSLGADRASIAADAGFSERHVNRLLAQEGTSITELFRKRRLAKSREALKQQLDRSINDIAREFGWTLSANFARDFKREFGLTPREARLLINKK